MRLALALALLIAAGPIAAPATAQTYAPAPWWMAQPVVAALGSVTTEMPSNRASFSMSYQAVDPSVTEATRAAADKVKPLDAALAAYGPSRVQVETTFSTQPLYQEYTDSNGRQIQNMRADKIERYAVTAQVSVQVRDLRLLERVYSTLVAAHPTYTGAVSFRLSPDNETRTLMFRQAVADAIRRARLSADATGAHLGALKLIDASGRACLVDELFGNGARSGDRFGGNASYDVPPPPPPPPPPAPMAPGAANTADNLHLSLQPPLQSVSAQACVIYALGS